MLSTNTFGKRNNYKEFVAQLLKVMTAECEDFPKNLRQYQKSLRELAESVADTNAPSPEEVEEAIVQQIGCWLLNAGFLGLKACYDHHANPSAPTFLEEDPEVYLQEDAVKGLPDYLKGKRVLSRFRAALPQEQQEKYVHIIEYICHLETVGPKLAHYWGYMLGNGLYSHIIPGFREDQRLTDAYRHMLEEYLELRIL